MYIIVAIMHKIEREQFMDTFLQLWGGIFYLLNKMLLSSSEGIQKQKLKKQISILGWVSFLIGMPAWIIILFLKQNWIIASIELGGVPSIILGIILIIKGKTYKINWLEKLSKICVYSFLIIGIIASVYDFGGITNRSQVLELFVIAGYLIGTNLLANKKKNGWLWFILMNGSMVILMLSQNKPYLAIQQGVSILFCIYGYLKSKKKEN